MSILLRKPEKQSNILSASFSGILALLETVAHPTPNAPNILSNLKNSFAALSGELEDEVGHRAWIWATKSITYAVSDLLVQQRMRAPLSKKKDQAIETFMKAAVCFGNRRLDEFSLSNPGASSVFQPAQDALPALILGATTGENLGIETLKEDFNAALRAASNRLLSEEFSYFSELENALTSKLGEGARRDAHWARHAHWITSQFTETPIFSPDEEEKIPLSAVYLPLRCFWHDMVEDQKEESGREVQEKRVAHVSLMHSEAQKWLKGDHKHDPIRVVTGGPGSGKSSFARALAHDVIKSGEHRVLFVRLQHTKLSGDLRTDIARYCDDFDTATSGTGNPGLAGNPLDWRKTDSTPLLLIFDGLDELSSNEQDSEQHARDFLLNLKLLLTPLNADGTAIRAIVLGRNVACEAAMRVARIDLPAMLNVAPIAPMDRATCMLPSQERDEDLQDPDNLMGDDQRKDYWEAWAKVKGLDPIVVPAPVTAKSMSELNLEPLLLHLLVISRYCGDEWEIAADNRNVVYEDILQKIFDRNCKKDHFQSLGLTEQLFFSLMECLGIAAWRGNGRTGDAAEFVAVRKLHLDREKKLKTLHAATLKSVALNIHTRSTEDEADGGFEFIHKSFGEYLAARGLLSHTKTLAARLEDKEPEDVEEGFWRLIGGAELTPEIIQFLYDEARRTLKPDQAIPAKNALTELLNWVIVHGFSVHQLGAEVSWTELANRQRCASSALVAATSAQAISIPIDPEYSGLNADSTVNLGYVSTDKFVPARFMEELGVTVELPVQMALRRINLFAADNWGKNLSRANLEGADLREGNFTWNLFIGSNLRNSQLQQARLSEAIFWSVDASNAKFYAANLGGAWFDGVDMSNVDLTNADLNKVRAGSENQGIIVSDFVEREIKGSLDLHGATLKDANLREADLRGALNLTVEMLNDARGNKDTLLPDYIDRSKIQWSNQQF